MNWALWLLCYQTPEPQLTWLSIHVYLSEWAAYWRTLSSRDDTFEEQNDYRSGSPNLRFCFFFPSLSIRFSPLWGWWVYKFLISRSSTYATFRWLLTLAYRCFLAEETRSVSNNIQIILQCALDFRSCLLKGTRDVGSDDQDSAGSIMQVNVSQVRVIFLPDLVSLPVIHDAHILWSGFQLIH